METKTFYLVWREGTVPSFRHSTLAAAETEAKRLAENTGQKFFVLEATLEVYPMPRTVTRVLTGGADDGVETDADVPF